MRREREVTVSSCSKKKKKKEGARVVNNREISVDAAVVAVGSEADGVFTLEEE